MIPKPTQSLPESLNPIMLEYARRPSWRRRLFSKRTVGLVLVIATIIVGWNWGPYAGRVLYWAYVQARCRAYSTSQVQVVYEEDRAKAKALITSGSSFLPSRFSFNDPSPIATYIPPIVRKLLHTDSYAATVFLHERTTKAGERRIVLLQFEDFKGSLLAGFWSDFTCTMWEPSFEPLDIPLDVQSSGYASYPDCRGFEIGAHSATRNLRMFAGQPDPNDKSHFTIAYQMGTEPGIIDGWLDDGGSGVSLRLAHRSGPATFRSDP